MPLLSGIDINGSDLYAIEFALIFNHKVDSLYDKQYRGYKERKKYSLYLGDEILYDYKEKKLKIENIQLVDKRGKVLEDEEIIKEVLERVKDYDLTHIYEEVEKYMRSRELDFTENVEKEGILNFYVILGFAGIFGVLLIYQYFLKGLT